MGVRAFLKTLLFGEPKPGPTARRHAARPLQQIPPPPPPPAPLPRAVEPNPVLVEDDEPGAYEVIQPWLTKAVEHKKAKEWDEAIECLHTAYKLAAEYPFDALDYSHYLRLPAYLQLAGRNDDAWACFNDYQCGQLPYKDQSNELALSIGFRAMVEDKKRLFLEREKKYRAALISRAVGQFLSASAAFRRHLDAMAAMDAQAWLEPDDDGYWHEELAQYQKENAEWNLEHSEKAVLEYGIPGIEKDLWKTAKKLKLSEETNEQLAATVFAKACGVTSEVNAVGQVVSAMREFAAVIDEALER